MGIHINRALPHDGKIRFNLTNESSLFSFLCKHEFSNMKLGVFTTLIPAILPVVCAAPARRDADNPPLRGSGSLVGYSSSNKGGGDSPPDIRYTLLPGQKEDPKIGSYLDFQKADNPQPIRGSTGADDPGPSTFATPQAL